MSETEFTQQQFDKIITLCSILNMEDATIASTLLQDYNWDIQKAIDELSYSHQNQNQNQHNINNQIQSQINNNNYINENNYENFENEFDDQNFQNFQYEYAYQPNPLEVKKQLFNQQYASFPLKKTTSQNPSTLQKEILNDQKLLAEEKIHAFAYYQNIAKNSQILYQRILASHPQQKRKIYDNKRKIINNKSFISHLYKTINPKINFTFGTFLLNLVRSYLQKKTLLVYIHKENQESVNSNGLIPIEQNKTKNSAAQLILTQKQIAQFVNKHCIVYGIFDNADDYQIIQKYVPLKQVPAFVLFTLDKKKQCQNYKGHYSIIRKEPNSFIQWLAKEIGIPIKKKEEKSSQNIPQALVSEKSNKQNWKISDIVNQQNWQYEEMEKMYHLRRQKSKFQKQVIQKAQQGIATLKKKFEKQPQQGQQVIQMKIRLPLTGKSIIRRFQKKDLIKQIFDFVNCFGRQEFQNQWSEFDLTQSYPKISLRQKMDKRIEQIFQDSNRQNIIVKQL